MELEIVKSRSASRRSFPLAVAGFVSALIATVRVPAALADGEKIVDALLANTDPGGVELIGNGDSLDTVRLTDDVAIAAGASYSDEIGALVDVEPDSGFRQNTDCTIQEHETGSGRLSTAIVASESSQEFRDDPCVPTEALDAPSGAPPLAAVSVPRPLAAGLAVAASGVAALLTRPRL